MGDLVIGWDLDSTLASTMHRRWLIPEIEAGRATWDDYSNLCLDDVPVPGTVALARGLSASGWVQYIISGRSESARVRTASWLRLHDVPADHLVLRPDGDPGRPDEWKIKKLLQLRDEGVEFTLYLEDWAPAAKNIMEKTDIPVLGVNPLDGGAILVTRDQLGQALHQEFTEHGLAFLAPADNGGWSDGSLDELATGVFEKLGGAF